MAVVKKRKTTKKSKSKAKDVLLPGEKTMERSCATCRLRKVRCSGDRPACTLCLRGAAARGLPVDGVRCVYAGASFFAKEGDGEVEEELGGRGARCEWGEGKGEGDEGRDEGVVGVDANIGEDACPPPLPPLVPTTAHFWDGGPLSSADIAGWSGLKYAAERCRFP
ncbi:hypothetical protein JCM6882_001226 [Rhodosporidiobolus microsporus]